MPHKTDKKTAIMNPTAEQPITDYEMVMAKIEHDAHKGYKGIENVALENEHIKKHDTDEVQP